MGYQYQNVELKPGGSDEIVTIHNLEEYIDRTLEWVFVRGVRSQLDSLRQGINSVFPMDKLGSFTPAEVKTMLCGDQEPIFTREEVIKYTEPKLGYTKESPGFIKFVNVLGGMTGKESIPPIHNWVFFAASRWSGESSSKIDNCAQD